MPDSKNPVVAQGELGSLIARTRRRVWQAASRHLEANGESMLTWQMLNCLARRGPITQREIASWLGQHPAGICRLLEALEGEGLVERARDAQDRRKLRVELTAKGQTRLEAMRPYVAAASRDVLAPLTLEEQLSLKALLEKLVDGADV